MYIIKADQACFEEATSILKQDNHILLGLYDDVEERYFALIAVTKEQSGKKKFYKSFGGLFLDSNSPALLKVFETEMVKYLKKNNIAYLKTTINSDIDITKCGLNYINDETKEFIIYGSTVWKILKKQ